MENLKLDLDQLNEELISYQVSKEKEPIYLIPTKEELDPNELRAVQFLSVYLACVILTAIGKSIADAITETKYAPALMNPFFWIYMSGIIVSTIGIIWGVNRLYKKHVLVKRRIAELKKQKEKEIGIL